MRRRVQALVCALFFCVGAHADVPDSGRDDRGRTPLMAAVHDRDLARVKALVAAGADVNALDNIHDSPFLYAGAEGLTEILKVLIAAGPDPKVLNRFGGTALIPAAHHGHVESVRLLLPQTDVDVNHVNRLGWSALLEAIILGDGGPAYREIVSLLLEYGADPNLADGQGVTPLAHADRRHYSEIARLLALAGAKR